MSTGAAERTLRELPGVRGISNEIVVRPRVEPKELQKKIKETFERRAELDAKNIMIHVTGGEVTLTGRVHSWRERYEAEQAAYAASGVTVVYNRLVVEPSEAVA